MKLKNFLLAISLLILSTDLFAQQKEAYPFENEIKDFKKMDAVRMPEKGGILFVGSSSIRKWTDLESRFADKPIIRRGVGGCQLSQIVDLYMDSIVYPYQPKKIFLYAGDNDLSAGQTADQVVANFEKFYQLVVTNNPKVKVYWMSVKLCNSRIKLLSRVTEVNKRIRAFLKTEKNGVYVDLTSVLLDAKGNPDDSLFEKDQLHLKPVGYDRWQEVLKKYL
ncbi:Lysophospholipase L1 [bacterium A37T11]|nr:Lysophospholipase L1 [bacterium A37T11]